MKKSLLLLFAIAMYSVPSFGQVSKSIAAPVWSTHLVESEPLPEVSLKYEGLEKILKEDSLESLTKGIAPRFAVAIDTLIDLKELGSYSTQGDMSRYELKIKSTEAKSIHLNFSNFYLPSGSILYLKGVGNKDQIGALGHYNNKVDKQFSTRPLMGESLLIDLYVPTAKLDLLSFQISQVVHGYRDLFHKSAKNFNSSGGCNRNTNCPEADLWQDVKRSVTIILTSNNTRWCSGTLINNVRKDSTPYLLTASHCQLGTNSIFVFGYENSSPNCLTNADGTLNNSISGAFSRAENSYSDFKLFELSITPPPSYNAYYAGWDANGVAPFESTTIHHPSGDIKKISQDYDTAISSAYSPPNNNTHWQVGNWESGTTEQGSSGSALFNQFKRVVGQLEGGSASCSQNLEDYFGKFSLSWNFNPATNRQLKHWLDPDNTNTLQMDGLDPLPKVNSKDIELTYVSSIPSYTCDTVINPVVYFMNKGNDSIQSLQILYGTNQQYNNSINWTGNLKTDEIAQQLINGFHLSQSDSIFNIRLVLNPFDQDTSNNGWTKTILVNPSPKTVSFTINTDQYGNETSWIIRDSSNGTLLHKGGPYVLAPDTTGNTYRDSLCLYSGCFELVLYDGYGDGFNSPFNGNGYVLIQDQYGDTLLYEANFTGSQKVVSFCLRDTSTSLFENKKNSTLVIFPNPVLRGETIYLKKENELRMGFQLYDLQGRRLLEGAGNSFNIPFTLTNGIYILQVNDDKGIVGREKIMVK